MHTYLNNLIKKLIVLIIVFAMTTCNASFAFDEYFKINNSPNKYININLSTTEIKGNIVTFSTKYNKDDDKVIINRVSINTNEKTAKLVKQDILDNNGKTLKSLDFSDTNQFKQIKDGTLMADLYDTAIILKLSSETFYENPDIWNKYFKTVENKITKKYHPNVLRWKQGLSTENKFASVIVLVDKNGKILSYEYKNYYPVKEKNFDNKFKQHVDNIFLKKDKFFPPLPKEYSGEKLIMKFRIFYTQDAENKAFIKQHSTEKGSGAIEVNKTSAPILGIPIFVVTVTRFVGILGTSVVAIPFYAIAPEATDKFTSKLYDKL
jgi:hypothetical protein